MKLNLQYIHVFAGDGSLRTLRVRDIKDYSYLDGFISAEMTNGDKWRFEYDVKELQKMIKM